MYKGLTDFKRKVTLQTNKGASEAAEAEVFLNELRDTATILEIVRRREAVLLKRDLIASFENEAETMLREDHVMNETEATVREFGREMREHMEKHRCKDIADQLTEYAERLQLLMEVRESEVVRRRAVSANDGAPPLYDLPSNQGESSNQGPTFGMEQGPPPYDDIAERAMPPSTVVRRPTVTTQPLFPRRQEEESTRNGNVLGSAQSMDITNARRIEDHATDTRFTAIESTQQSLMETLNVIRDTITALNDNATRTRSATEERLQQIQQVLRGIGQNPAQSERDRCNIPLARSQVDLIPQLPTQPTMRGQTHREAISQMNGARRDLVTQPQYTEPSSRGSYTSNSLHVMGSNPEEIKLNIKLDQMKASATTAVLATMKPFSGEVYEYTTFIGQFECLVQNNRSIDYPMKQAILIKLLPDHLALEHQTPQMNEDNYWTIRQNLDRQFNRQGNQVVAILQKIEETTFPQHDLDLLKGSLNSFANQASKLRPFGFNTNDPYFMFNFVRKLPEKIRRVTQTVLQRGNTTFNELMNIAQEWVSTEQSLSFGGGRRLGGYDQSYTAAINQVSSSGGPGQQQLQDNNEHRAMQGRTRSESCGDDFNTAVNQVSSSRGNGQQPHQRPESGKHTVSKYKRWTRFNPPSKTKPCRYCDDASHSASECIVPVEEKTKAVIAKSLCHNCLSEKHRIMSCRSKYSCFNCNKRHFTGHCPHLKKDDVMINQVGLLCNYEDDEELEKQLFRGDGAETPEF
ncbi:hypothetical protein CRE_05676 [Caenorhabditis remanei]|uniref:CCHC-type domain-containing protein n=1 Tax=Caenorhabditis remanei TaxID=31234 RepID=E3M0P7_CAERE|nr:hypothetical protein CRE_05676 [Caenorhabditis remanei]